MKTERKMMKLKVQFGWETRFDQPIRRIARTRVQLVVRHPGFVARVGNGRTAETDYPPNRPVAAIYALTRALLWLQSGELEIAAANENELWIYGM
jgi:hypothetical protein